MVVVVELQVDDGKRPTVPLPGTTTSTTVILQPPLPFCSLFLSFLFDLPNTVEMPTIREKFWFDDGDVVLNANDTLFRIHKGILTAQSTFFKGMFSLPTPEKRPEQTPDYYQGLPVVRMQGDDEVDVERLLEVLYDPLYVSSIRLLSNTCVLMP